MKAATAVVAGVVLAVGAASPAFATEEPTVEVFWLMPETSTPIPPTGNNPSIWPQQYSPDGATQCGRWYQADVYKQSDADLLTADGVLTEGEDYEVVISWRFVYAGDCEPVDEAPVEPEVPAEPEVPVVEEPVEEPVIEPVVQTVPEKTLAHTGPNDVTPIVGFMGLGALLLGAGLMVLRRLKVKN